MQENFTFKQVIVIAIVISILTSAAVGFVTGRYFSPTGRGELVLAPGATSTPVIVETPQGKETVQVLSQDQAVINVVKKTSPAVVSIIITKDLPIIEQEFVNPFEGDPFFRQFFGPFEFQVPQFRQKGTEKREVGGGTGFIISSDGLVLTNKHITADSSADYTVLTNDGQKIPARVLAQDPVQDLAVIKIDRTGLPTLALGDSDKIQIGQTAIAIGNALGEFRNTVSIGVISGIGRRITAEGGGLTETLEDVIQTDAAINPGNSGGPLLNLRGEVVGINTALVQGAQNIGFAIPINKAKKDIQDVKTRGKIVTPFLGVRHVLVTKDIQQRNNLPVDYGALIVRGPDGEPGIQPGSPAEKASLREGDIILELNGTRIEVEHSLGSLIANRQVGEEVTLKVLRGSETLTIKARLEERK